MQKTDLPPADSIFIQINQSEAKAGLKWHFHNAGILFFRLLQISILQFILKSLTFLCSYGAILYLI